MTSSASPSAGGFFGVPLWMLVTLLVFLVGVAGVYFFMPLSSPSDPYAQELQSILDANQQADFMEAADRAHQIAITSPDPNQQAFATKIEAYSKLSTGTTSQQVAAVETMKAQYRKDEGNAAAQAKDIATMLEFITSSRNYDVFRAVFADEFTVFILTAPNGKPDILGSIGRLAAHGASLHKTSDLLYQMALSKLGPNVDFWVVYNLSDEKKMANTNIAIPYVEEAEQLYALESRAPSAYVNLLAPMKAHYWSGILWADVAHVYPKYLEQSEAAFKKSFEYYETTRDAKGDRYPVIEARMPIHYMGYALALYENAASGRRPDIEATLDELIAMVRANPTLHETQIIAQIRRAGLNAGVGGGFRTLGEFYKPFADFLAEYGFNVQ